MFLETKLMFVIDSKQITFVRNIYTNILPYVSHIFENYAFGKTLRVQ